LQGPDKGRRFELPDEPVLIGRESRQLPITDNTVSRRHAELLPDGGNWVLKDMGSSNGSYVNGTRVNNRYSLKLGDQIRVGRTLMVFGAQPGVTRTSGGNVALTGVEAGMDSSIMHTLSSNDDSMVLAVPEPAAVAMTNLKILYQLGAALGSSFGIEQVMEVVMDLVFEHVKADRGIIFLFNDKNELVPKVVRTREDTDRNNGKAPRHPPKQPAEDEKIPVTSENDPPPQPEKIHASRTIINHVLSSGEGVLSSNAMADRRFSAGKSVHSLGIRSALCVPIKAAKLSGKKI
jgi:adenylate cyclase